MHQIRAAELGRSPDLWTYDGTYDGIYDRRPVAQVERRYTRTSTPRAGRSVASAMAEAYSATWRR
jgi:hypothetical protein